jgi:hypothetical protein
MPGRRVSRNRKMNRKRSGVSRKRVNKSVRSKRRTRSSRRSRRSKRIVRKSLRGGMWGGSRFNKPMLEETRKYIMDKKNMTKLDESLKDSLIGSIAKTLGKKVVNAEEDNKIKQIVEEQYEKWKALPLERRKTVRVKDRMITDIITTIERKILKKSAAIEPTAAATSDMMSEAEEADVAGAPYRPVYAAVGANKVSTTKPTVVQVYGSVGADETAVYDFASSDPALVGHGTNRTEDGRRIFGEYRPSSSNA